MTTLGEIETAFEAALEQVTRVAAAGFAPGIAEQLRQLDFRLRAERVEALERGTVDREWVRKTIRWVVEWMPETDLTVIAALGRIARLAPAEVS